MRLPYSWYFQFYTPPDQKRGQIKLIVAREQCLLKTIFWRSYMENLETLLTDVITADRGKNILITGNEVEDRFALRDIVWGHVRKIDYGKPHLNMLFESVEDFVPEVQELLDARDENYPVVTIDDLADNLDLFDGISGEREVIRLLDAEDITVIAVTRHASAETLTDLLMERFDVVLTSRLTSDLNSRIVLGRSGAECLDKDTVLLKDCNGIRKASFDR